MACYVHVASARRRPLTAAARRGFQNFGSGTLAYHGSGTRPTPGPFPSTNDGLGRLELAFGGSAIGLGHFREALTFAGVLALAGVFSALAGALALAGIGANAVAF